MGPLPTGRCWGPGFTAGYGGSAACLDALADGVEQRIDLGVIGDRTFVNNASFGAYAEVVPSPACRDDKTGETVMMLTPVRCAIRPRALRVRVPRNRLLAR